MDLNNKRVIISRTDSIGDVMLTLPICAWLKKTFPKVEIVFLGKGYTKSVVEAYAKVDVFEDWNDYLNAPDKIQKFRALKADAIMHVFPNKEIASLAKKVRIPVRIGTSHRAYHLFTCSHRLNFTRKKSKSHEAQLNHELLRPFGLKEYPSLEEIYETTTYFNVPDVALPEEFKSIQNATILHPKSQGSAKEWPLEKYMTIAKNLAEKGAFVVFTGTKQEGDLFRDQIPNHARIIDTTGKLTLEQLMVFISRAKNLLACSTGPLHIAGYYGVNTIGLFSPKRPIHPGRWKALGKKVNILVFDQNCTICAKRKDCTCIEKITVDAVMEVLK